MKPASLRTRAFASTSISLASVLLLSSMLSACGGGDSSTTAAATSVATVATLAGTAGVVGSNNGTGAAAQFSSPLGITADSTGDVFVADTGNNIIREISAYGVVSTIAGTAGITGSADGTGAAAQFSSPQGMAIDGSGNLYVADASNNTIRMVSATGVVTTIAGTAGTAGSADGTGTAAQFNHPTDVAIDSSGNLYVTDTGNNTIREISPSNVVSTIAGTAGTAGAADGMSNAAQFNQPNGLAVDGAGNIFVADTGNSTIREISASGVVTTLAGVAGQIGTTDGYGSGALFAAPYGIAVDANDDLFITDNGGQTLRELTPPSASVVTIAGIPAQAGAVDGNGLSAQFNHPSGIVLNSAGYLYIADTGNSTIRAISFQ